MKIYAIIDLKAKVPAAIFTSANDESAERSFLQLLAGSQTVYADFPTDFAVYPVGDLSVEGLTLRVSAPGSEVLLKNGFTVGSFTINDAVKLGSDYDRAYLTSLRDLLAPEKREKAVVQQDSDGECACPICGFLLANQHCVGNYCCAFGAELEWETPEPNGEVFDNG